jgi:hypothetical protein
VRSFWLTFLAVLAATPATSAWAQARVESVLRPGARVRYLLPQAPSPFTGVINRVDAAGILVHPDSYDGSIHLGFDSLQSLAVARSRSAVAGAARGAFTGIKIGALLGIGLTTLAWLSTSGDCCQDSWLSVTQFVGVLSTMGTLGLGAIGGVWGAVLPGVVWHEVPLPERR